jgi:hypothetical protein
MRIARGIGGFAAAAGLWLAAAGAAPAQTADAVPRFDGERAFSWLEYQCALGPRLPGGAAHAALQQAFAAHADSLGLRHAELCFTAHNPLDGASVRYCNVIISAGPRNGARLWLGAHYDTRPVSDQDPDPALRSRPLPGANDGASGVAVLLHLAELLAEKSPPLGVDLVFFDGEDSGRSQEPLTFCLGSRRLAANWDGFGSPLGGGTPLGLIVLDLVGERGLRIPVEGYSLQAAPGWTQLVFARATELGLSAFVPVPGPRIYDDHVPFLERGIPAVDLIDFDYPAWHTTADVPSACAAASLEQVGRLVVSFCYDPPETR